MTNDAISDIAGPVPARLKCSICNKLAQDPYRLPCCEKSICATCHNTIPEACPLCGHRPIRAEDCIENVPLRKTVQVFLRHAQQKSAPRSENAPSQDPPSTGQNVQMDLKTEGAGGELSQNGGVQGNAFTATDSSGVVTEGQSGTFSSNQWTTINPVFNPMGFPNASQLPVNNSEFDAYGMNPQLQQDYMRQQMTLMQQQAMFGFDPTMMMMGFDQFNGGFGAAYGQDYYRGRGGYRGRGRGRGGYDARQHGSPAENVQPPPEVPGAPSAPRAMLIARGRGREISEGHIRRPSSADGYHGNDEEQRGRQRSRTARSCSSSTSRSHSRGRSRTPRQYESETRSSDKSRSSSRGSQKDEESSVRSRSQSPQKEKHRKGRSQSTERSLSPERSHRKSSKSRSSRSSRDRSHSKERSSRRSSHRESSSRRHRHRSRSRDSKRRREHSSSRSHSHREREDKKDSGHRRHSHDSERSHRHSSSHRRRKEQEYSPSDRSLSPVHEDLNWQDGKSPEADQEDPPSQSALHSKSRSSRFSHSHRRHRHSERHRDSGDRRHRRHRHDESSDGRSRSPKPKSDDTRRRSIHYEDDIENTVRKAEREREQQRWK